MLIQPRSRRGASDKIRCTTPYIGTSYTVYWCERLVRLHRMMVLTEPYDGYESEVFGLLLHRIVVTFIYLPYV